MLPRVFLTAALVAALTALLAASVGESGATAVCAGTIVPGQAGGCDRGTSRANWCQILLLGELFVWPVGYSIAPVCFTYDWAGLGEMAE
jgi:hypothetical protein